METQVAESGIVAQTVTLTGTYVAGRDLIVSETKVIRSVPEFTTVDLGQYSRDDYQSPKFTRQLLEVIREKRLLIVGGNYGFDKGTFIRYLAALLERSLTGVTAKEWHYTSDFYSVFSKIYEEASTSIFILNQIVPQHVNYNVAKLISLASQKGHYILISTDSPAEAWKLSTEIIRDHWFEIPSEELYEENTLTTHLCKLFNNNNGLTGALDLPPGGCNADTAITAGLSMREAANRLRSPYKIELFYKLLLRRQTTLRGRIVREILDSLTGDTDEETLRQWFLNLTEIEKIIALGAILFDGLYDDQFFSAMRFVVDDHWHLREEKLRVLDYCDLENLLNFYKLETVDGKEKIIRSKFPDQRLSLLRIIWDSHRRHVINVLPTLVRMVYFSVNQNNSLWELSGNDQRKERLHSTISTVLSDIGLISLPAVESTLIELAAVDHIEVQSVAAKAMALWRRNNAGVNTFSVLDGWQKSTKVGDLVSDLLAKRNKENKQPDQQGSKASKSLESKSVSRSYVRATIGLTLGFACQYDNPGNLSTESIGLLKQLVNDPDEFVRQRLIEVSLPQILSQHFVQLQDLVKELTQYMDLIYSIARGLALGYNNYPGELLELLDTWIEYCRTNRTWIGNEGSYSVPDKVLLTVILTLGEIDFKSPQPAFDMQAGFSRLTELQTDFSLDRFRSVFRRIIKNKVLTDLTTYQAVIVPLLSSLSLVEQDDIVTALLTVLADQRQELPNGEAFVWIEDRYMPVWVDGHRPFTEVENILFQWLSSEDETAQQVAARTVACWTKKFEAGERGIIDAIKERRNKEAEAAVQTSTPPKLDRKPEVTWTMKLAFYFSRIPTSDNLRRDLRNIFPNMYRTTLTEKHYEIIEDLWAYKDSRYADMGAYLNKVFKRYVTVKNVVAVVAFVLVFGTLAYFIIRAGQNN